MTTLLDDPLLGFGLPRDDPGEAARTAQALTETADRVGVLLRRVGAMLPVRRWSGLASVAADRDLTSVALALAQERQALVSAAAALSRFAAGVSLAQASADEARRLVATARSVQRSADLRAPATAVTGWGGTRLDGPLHDPAAVALLDRARRRAYDARSTYDVAARRLTAELTELSGRRVVRAGLSPRLLLDVVGLVPVAGDVVDLGNAAAYALQGRWGDATLTAVAAVPGPEGWAAASAKIGKAWSRADRITDVVTVVARLTERGRRSSNRVLADDDAIAALYFGTLRHLGRTEVRQGPLGEVLVTFLPGGGQVSYRTASRDGGYVVQFTDVPGVTIDRIHRRG
jgi:hypothetical protein